MPKAPQDHKAKTATAFTFEAAGKKYSIPFASVGAEKIPGRAMRDALLGGNEGESRLGFLLLEACGADQDAVDALYDLPVPAMLRIIAEWMKAGDGQGASLPQS